MDFYINKNATLPLLQMELINNGRVDQKDFFQCIQNSDITFCMKDLKTGQVVVSNKPAICIVKKSKLNPTDEEYLIGYKFTQRETKKEGTFVGQFIIDFKDGGGTLLVPIQEELFIHVLDSSLKK